MSDIVEQLRRWAGSYEEGSFDTEADLMGNAADEIDRLRKALDTIRRKYSDLAAVTPAPPFLPDVWVSASTMKEDAPKDCEYFLVFRRGGERLGELAIRADQIGIARYVPDDRTGWRLETNWQYGSKYALSEPTHWAKIPTPPKAEEVAEQ
jgi:hypothetical protein